jgi:dienelactone hydrolase
MNNTNRLLSLLLTLSIACLPALAATGVWYSKAIGGNISYKTTEAAVPLKDASNQYLTVVYLENLGLRKIGGNSNATDVAWLLSQGYRVIELDYGNRANAVSTGLNMDIIDINDALAGTFCGLADCSKYRSWVLFEGYRIARDVPYFLDDPKTYNYPTSYVVGDSIRMDIIYPANTEERVPAVLSFSYSNSSASVVNRNQRLNLGNSLAGFNDSFLEGAPTNGIAWAIADHPKYCPWGNGKPVGGANDLYKSYEVNPDAAQKVKSAVRTLRAMGANLNLSGKIGIYGFSRGSDAGSMAVGDRSVPLFENAGLNQSVSDDVQVAALGSGVFDFKQVFNASGDGDSNLETKCPLAWGPLASNAARWDSMGSAYLVKTVASAPVIFFYNTDDALYYQDQIKHFKAKLDSIGVRTDSVINYGTGHAVPQTAAPLNKIYSFFKEYLTPPSVVTEVKVPSVKRQSLTLSPNPAKTELSLSYDLPLDGNRKVELYDLSGNRLYSSGKHFRPAGRQRDSIELDKLHLAQGVYYVKVESSSFQGSESFVKE